PGVGADDGRIRRQRVADRRRVGAVAVDGGRLGVYRAAVVGQRERDRAAGVVAAGERRRVGQDRRGAAAQSDGAAGCTYQRRAGRIDDRLLQRAALVVGGLVVGVAVIGRGPLVVAGDRGIGRQGVAGGRRVGAVAVVDSDCLGVHHVA